MSLNTHHNMRLSFISNSFLTFNNSSNINMFNVKRKCFFECVVREFRLPLSYSIEYSFGLCSHKGNGREFTAHIFERVAAVVKIVIDNQPSVVRWCCPNVGINRFNIGGRVVDIAQCGKVFA